MHETRKRESSTKQPGAHSYQYMTLWHRLIHIFTLTSLIYGTSIFLSRAIPIRLMIWRFVCYANTFSHFLALSLSLALFISLSVISIKDWLEEEKKMSWYKDRGWTKSVKRIELNWFQWDLNNSVVYYGFKCVVHSTNIRCRIMTSSNSTMTLMSF